MPQSQVGYGVRPQSGGCTMTFTKVDYTEIDAILMPWLKRNTLYVYKWLRDDPVRMIDVIDDAGNIYNISIAPPDVSDIITVAVSGSGNRTSYETSLSELEQILDKSFAQILAWVKQAGFTRTSV